MFLNADDLQDYIDHTRDIVDTKQEKVFCFTSPEDRHGIKDIKLEGQNTIVLVMSSTFEFTLLQEVEVALDAELYKYEIQEVLPGITRTPAQIRVTDVDEDNYYGLHQDTIMIQKLSFVDNYHPWSLVIEAERLRDKDGNTPW